MSEKDKTSTIELFDALTEELRVKFMRAKELLFEYNHSHPHKIEEREAIIRELLGSTGKTFFINQPFYCDFGYNIHIGENFQANVGVTILDGGEVRIGDNVLIGPNVDIYTVGHPENIEDRIAGKEYSLPITIGNNVWIGGCVVITPGVTIGENSIIGAGSVVTHDIPSNVVAVGNPCHVLRACKIK
ncbi:MAG: sugar O-acetyltransferase [Rikenellaceae bacterium]